MQPIRLIRGFLSVGAWTLLSRAVGFIRDMMIAAFLGTGPVAQAYIVAFTLPNMFRRFFAEGAFNTAFVPMFAKRLESGENARGFAEEAFAGLFSVVLVVSLIAHLAMPWLVFAMAAGFKGDERFDLAVIYGRICFPYILFISLTALLSGRPREVIRVVRRDAPKHPSPNAGPIESAFAATLDVRIGGENVYAGIVEDRGVLGDGAAVALADVPRAVALSRKLSWASLVALVSGRLAYRWLRTGM